MIGSQRKDEKIKCPKCDIYMRKQEIELPGPNIIIDFCVQCHSYWFDKGELNRYIGTGVVDRDLKRRSGIDSWGKPKCPRCGGRVTMKYLESLEIDHCEDCGGIWLDHGELRSIQEKDLENLKERRVALILERLKELREKRFMNR
ncbi:MAG: zf-TFIIB domain-containing protein [Thermoplasmatota archaeon]